MLKNHGIYDYVDIDGTIECHRLRANCNFYQLHASLSLRLVAS